MTKPLKNVVLTESAPISPPDAVDPGSESDSNEYPKAVYHKDSTKAAMLSRVVQSAEEEKAAAAEGYVPFQALKLESKDAGPV